MALMSDKHALNLSMLSFGFGSEDKMRVVDGVEACSQTELAIIVETSSSQSQDLLMWVIP